MHRLVSNYVRIATNYSYDKYKYYNQSCYLGLLFENCKKKKFIDSSGENYILSEKSFVVLA